MHKILACLPVYHAVEPLPFMNFLRLAQEVGNAEAAGRYRLRWMVAGPKVKTHKARNNAARQALADQATHLLFIDDDMCVPAGMLDYLLEHDVDVVSPLFFRCAGDLAPLVFQLDQRGEPEVWEQYPRNQLFEAPGGTGTGVMLIKTDVLAAMEEPWFFYRPDSERSMDVNFCMMAREKGFRTWCDSRLICQQMGLPRAVGEPEWLQQQVMRAIEPNEEEVA